MKGKAPAIQMKERRNEMEETLKALASKEKGAESHPSINNTDSTHIPASVACYDHPVVTDELLDKDIQCPPCPNIIKIIRQKMTDLAMPPDLNQSIQGMLLIFTLVSKIHC